MRAVEAAWLNAQILIATELRCARAVIAGIETMHMIKKGQLQCPDGQASSAADKFYSLAF